MTIRAVIDTSSLVPFELRRRIQEATQLGVFVGIWSPWIIAELNRVLVWRWIKNPPSGLARDDLSRANERRCGAAAKQMMELLLSSFELVNPRAPYPPTWENLTDEWDHPIWAAAKLGHAQYVISENTRHYPPRQSNGRHIYEGIEYMSAHAFLNLLIGDMGD
jgi:hypothetical protein